MLIMASLAAAVPCYAAQVKAAPGAQKNSPQSGDAKHKDAREANVSLKNLPPAVRATVENETKNAKIKSVSKEKEKGKTVYELETMVGTRSRDLTIDEAGKVYVVEDQIDPASAPVPVRAALEKRGSILKLESVQENGTTT
jgi:uncharacterized membrane protein YkoI